MFLNENDHQSVAEINVLSGLLVGVLHIWLNLNKD